MSKAALIMEMPEKCMSADGHICCPLAWDTKFCSRYSPKGIHMNGYDWEKIYESGKRPDWCPLRPVPEKDMESYFPDEWQDGYASGWNACIDAIGKPARRKKTI